MYSIGQMTFKARRYANMNQKKLYNKTDIVEASLSRYEMILGSRRMML